MATRDQAQVITGGDVVWAEPGEEHWHGACGDSLLTHLAVSHGPAEWAGEVDEHDYRRPTLTARRPLRSPPAARPGAADTTWMSLSCCSNDMNAASTPYERGIDPRTGRP